MSAARAITCIGRWWTDMCEEREAPATGLIWRKDREFRSRWPDVAEALDDLAHIDHRCGTVGGVTEPKVLFDAATDGHDHLTTLAQLGERESGSVARCSCGLLFVRRDVPVVPPHAPVPAAWEHVDDQRAIAAIRSVTNERLTEEEIVAILADA